MRNPDLHRAAEHTAAVHACTERARWGKTCCPEPTDETRCTAWTLSGRASCGALGLARCGSVAHHGSGEIFVAFATPGRRPRGEAPSLTVPDRALNDVFEAVVDATEEAVLNALWAAPEVVGRDGRIGHAIPHDAVLELLAAHGRLRR